MFNEIEKIEVSLRSTLANVVAKETGDQQFPVYRPRQVRPDNGTDKQGSQ